jgi:hypothetical protein
MTADFRISLSYDLLNFVKSIKQETIGLKTFDFHIKKIRQKLIIIGHDFLSLKRFYYISIMIHIQDFIKEILFFSIL